MTVMGLSVSGLTALMEEVRIQPLPSIVMEVSKSHYFNLLPEISDSFIMMTILNYMLHQERILN